jgi:large subunit ribosomal protein L15
MMLVGRETIARLPAAVLWRIGTRLPFGQDIRKHAVAAPSVADGHVRQGEATMKLNELRDNPGAAKKQKRVARGPGSGKGKTAGRGIKGQKSRSGVAINAYEGGQMPLYMRLPKRGFNKPNRKEFAVVNLGLIQKFVDAGKLDASAAIDEAALVQSGLVRRKLDGVRVLAKGEVSAALNLTVTGASKAAVDAVEKAGGTLTVTAPQADAAAE